MLVPIDPGRGGQALAWANFDQPLIRAPRNPATPPSALPAFTAYVRTLYTRGYVVCFYNNIDAQAYISTPLHRTSPTPLLTVVPHQIHSMNTSMSTSQAAFTGEGPKLQLEWSWRTWGGRIYDHADPETSIYTMKAPPGGKNLIFTTTADDMIVGRGILHSFSSINADYELHGRQGVVQALGRLKMSYSSLSKAYSEDGDTPMTMTWTSTTGLKKFDVICLDNKQLPVARVSCDVWARKDFASIEFMGAKANDPAVRDEIVVVGLTLLFTMVSRTMNPLKLAGSVFSKVGPIETKANGK